MIKKFLLATIFSASIVTGGFAQNSQSKTSAAINLQWEELGPNNSGGKIKALLIDKTDPNKAIAAAASGGLWKTTDNGLNWTKLKDDFENNIITCIAQAANGDIYLGTGERAYGFLGGGIWKSTDGGSTFNRLSSTIPATLNDTASAWAYVNELGVDPSNASRIYAATNKGLMVTSDAGNTWADPIGIAKVCTDVKVGSDGSVIAAVDSSSNKVSAFVSGDGLNNYIQVSGAGSSKLPNSTAYSVKFAIAPSDPNYIYAAVVKRSTMVGIYRSTDKGVTWSVIGPGGSSTFSPLGTTLASYAFDLEVMPNDKNYLFLGGQDVYTWTPTQNWSQLTSHFYPAFLGGYVHDNIHDFKFTNNGIWVASDGGISRGNETTGFVVINNGLATSQINDVATDRDGNVVLSTNSSGANLMYNGGHEATKLYGSVGGSVRVSNLNPLAFFVTDQYGQLYRAKDRESYGNAYSERLTDQFVNGNFLAGLPGAANRVTPMAYWESANDPFSKDSVLFTNDTLVDILPGSAVQMLSPNASVPFTTVTNDTIYKGQTVKLPHKVQARAAVGFSNEVWLANRMLDFIATPEWFRVAGGKPIYGGAYPTVDSAQVKIQDGSTVSAIEFTKDGNTLLFATTVPGNGSTAGAYLYRVDNIATAYDSVNGDISSKYCKLVGTKIAFFAKRNISSIAPDPNDTNKVVITLNGYNNNSYGYVYRTSNLKTLPPSSNDSNFENIQGNLPKMPVHDAIIDYTNSNQLIIGTDAGVYSTDNGFASSPTSVNWGESNTGIAKVPVMSIYQQTLKWNEVVNSGYIYAGTFGRGVYKTNALAGLRDQADNTVKTNTALLAYPNPAKDNVSVKYTLTSDSDVSVKMFDITGKLVYSESKAKVMAGDNTLNIKVADYEAGVYVITVTGSQIKKYVNVVITK